MAEKYVLLGPVVLFFGGCMKKECLEERKRIKEFLQNKFVNLHIIDPYKEDWSYENIYDEVLGIIRSDIILFYKPGKLSKKEMKIADALGRDYIIVLKDEVDLEDLEIVILNLVGNSEVQNGKG